MKTHNNTILKSIFIMLIGLAFANPMWAQGKQTASERATDLTNLMRCQLELNSEQLPKVYAVNLKAAQSMDSVSAAYKMNTEGLLEASRKVAEEHSVALQDVLKPSQWSKYERLRINPEKARKSEQVCKLEE